MSTCYNNPEKSSTTKKDRHKASRYSLFTQFSFDATKNKLDCWRGKDCMEMFCKDLKEHVTKIINYEKKKEMMPLTNEEKGIYCRQKNVICGKKDLVIDNRRFRQQNCIQWNCIQ